MYAVGFWKDGRWCQFRERPWEPVRRKTVQEFQHWIDTVMGRFPSRKRLVIIPWAVAFNEIVKSQMADRMKHGY